MKNEVKVRVSLLREKAAAHYLGMSADTLRKSHRYKGLIPYVKFRNTIRYRRADLDAYIEANRVESHRAEAVN